MINVQPVRVVSLKKDFQTKNESRLFSMKKSWRRGATKLGMHLMFKQDIEIVVKLDADGQMNPDLIPELINL